MVGMVSMVHFPKLFYRNFLTWTFQKPTIPTILTINTEHCSDFNTIKQVDITVSKVRFT